MANTIGTLIFEIAAGTARLQQDMAKAQATVKSAMDGIGSAVNTAKATIATLGVGLGLHEFASFVQGGIESVAMLERLALRTGLTVELLSSLRAVAAASRTDMDSVAAMVSKLDKNMLDFADRGGGKAAAAFQKLGFTQDEVREGLKNMDAFLPEFAQRLIATGEGGERVGLAMELLGKSGAMALPFLNELANAHQLVATRTTEQAQRAHELEAEMSKVSQRSQMMKEDFAIGLTPALMATVEAFNQLREKGQGAQSLGETLGTVLRYAATAAGSFWLALKDMGDGLGALMAQAAALATGDLAAVRAIGAERDAQEAKNKAAFEAFQKHMLDVDAIQAPAAAAAKSMTDQATAAEATAEALDKQMTAEELLAKQAAFRARHMEDIERSADAMQQVDDAAAKTSKSGEHLGYTFSSAFEKAVLGGEKLSDVLKSLDQDIARVILRAAVTKPLENAVAGAVTNSGFTLGSVFGGGMASGGPVSAGMSYLVGESGPEILTMGAGSGNITPNGGGGTYYIDARGADAAAVARLESGLRQVNASIEYRATAAVQRAYNQRGALTPMG